MPQIWTRASRKRIYADLCAWIAKKTTIRPKFVISTRRQTREAEQEIEKTPDRASDPRARNDATELDLLIEDGELETKGNCASSSRQLLLNRSQLKPLNLMGYPQMKYLWLWTLTYAASATAQQHKIGHQRKHTDLVFKPSHVPLESHKQGAVVIYKEYFRSFELNTL